MPSLNRDELTKIISFFPKFKNAKIFIETGTYKGETIIALSKYFKKLYTVEFKKEFYDTLIKASHPKNIKFYNNKSTAFLKNILPNLIEYFDEENIIFFLDAHWAGIDTGFSGKDCPLLDELTIINKFCNKALIIIDDYNKFGIKKQKYHHKNLQHKLLFGISGKIEDWSEITLKNVLSCFNNRTINYNIIGNRLIVEV
jgi:hypothetical protein